jgi:hypothetical protein
MQDLLLLFVVIVSCAPQTTGAVVTVSEPAPTATVLDAAVAPEPTRSVALTYEGDAGPTQLTVHAPARAMTQPDVCALLARRDLPAPRLVLANRFDGAPLRLATHAERQGAALVLGCDERVPDGNQFLVPDISCADGGPSCTFSLKSGDTSVPPYERTYWFDFDAAGHAALVAVVIPVL